jgi:single-strand DNA-binding protein
MSTQISNTNRLSNSFSGTSVSEKRVRDYRYEVTGELFQVDEIQDFPGGFCIRKFVIMDESSYPSPICFDLLKSDVRVIERFSIGDRIKIIFKLKGREWNGKYFSNIQALKIEKVHDNASQCEEDDVPF